MINKYSHSFMKKWILLWSCIFILCIIWSSPIYAQDDCLSTCQENDDKDNDGLSDNFENCLAMKHAPVLYLPVDLQYRWSKHRWPTNVEWYLRRASMRFNHDNSCFDCPVVDNFPWDAPSVFDTLISQHHKYRSDWPWCEHEEPIIYSDITKRPHWREHHNYFLQLLEDTHHRGSNDPSDWKVYVHSYPTMQGVDIEYWFFYAYNDNAATSNHEGDWEHITVKLDQNLDVFKVLFHAHGDDPDERNVDEVQWLDGKKGGHPLVWVALGSHASYYRDGDECNKNWKEGYDTSCQTKDEYRWFTWSGGRANRPGYQGYGLVQVGETLYPLNGQTWIKYSGRWGEVGEFGYTSGPGGPSSKWGENQVGKDAIPSNWITGYEYCGKPRHRGRSPWLPQALTY